MKIRTHKRFDKAFAKLQPRQKEAVKNAISSFLTERENPTLRDHALQGKLTGLRSFSAGWNLRIIYREEGGFITIILLDVGTHNQVY